MKRLLITLTMLLALGTVSALAQPGMGPCHDRDYQGHKGGQGMRGDGDGAMRLLRLADELELTDQQVGQIKAQTLAFKTEMVDKKAAIKKTRLQLGALRHEEDASEREIFSLIDEAAMLQAEVKKMQVAHRNSVKALLTDQQLDKMKALRKERGKQHRGEMKERHQVPRKGHRRGGRGL